MRRFLFVVNPLAGGVNKAYFLERVREFCHENRIGYEIIQTIGKYDRESLQEKLGSYRPEIAVAAGGDGTVNLVAEAVAGTRVIMGVVPLGSGNGFSKDMGIPQDIPQALQLLLTGRNRAIDSLRANRHFFVHLADIGFNAKIVKLFSKTRNRGIFTYLKYMIREFFHYKAFMVNVVMDGSDFHGKAFMVTAANLNSYGTNLVINPNGKGDDGVFEIIILKRFPRAEALNLFFQLLFRKITFSPYYIILQGSRACIESPRAIGLQVDGEPEGWVKKVEIKIHPGNVLVMVPK